MTLPRIVRLRNYRHYPPPGTGITWLDYSAPKDKVFVAIVLGTENKEGSDPLPLMDLLRMLEIDGVAVVPDEAQS